MASSRSCRSLARIDLVPPATTPVELPPDQSARITVWGWQRYALLGAGLLTAAGIVLSPLATLIVLNALGMLAYLGVLAFRFYATHRAERIAAVAARNAPAATPERPDASLPIYTILCPLYREADTVALFLQGMQRLDYPFEKLDVRLLLEADDHETQAAARAAKQAMDSPDSIQLIVVPDSQPKTKPKACNYGLLGARGEYVVIYDAEDIPEPDQLKKALFAFEQLPDSTVCVQAKLNYFNPDQNLLTRFFTAEYSMWFDLFLPGLFAVGAPIPLGGTSNHFKVDALRELGGWDPFNVAEDADLGMRIARSGLSTAVIDSTTWEEANSRVGNWIRQRSRWVKGYLQTWLVSMRHPKTVLDTLGVWRFLCLQATVGGTPLVLLLNPIYWLLTVVYLLTTWGLIPHLFPPPVFVASLLGALVGNLVFVYLSMYGLLQRQRYDLVPLMLLSPLYWVLQSVAAWKALYQLITKPHYWEKTVHNLAYHPASRGEVDDLSEAA
jgi:glycosyltransferase XagB